MASGGQLLGFIFLVERAQSMPRRLVGIRAAAAALLGGVGSTRNTGALCSCFGFFGGFPRPSRCGAFRLFCLGLLIWCGGVVGG